MNKSLKILIATGIYPPDIGGPATYAYNLSRELTRLGHEVNVLTYSDDQSGCEGNLCKVSRQKGILFRYLENDH